MNKCSLNVTADHWCPERSCRAVNRDQVSCTNPCAHTLPLSDTHSPLEPFYKMSSDVI
jgi:hypothetical protein